MRLLERTLKIRGEQFAVVQAFFVFFVGIGMFYTVGATVGDTLFLSHLRPEQVPRTLPWVYVGIAAASIATAILFDAVQMRISRLGLVVGVQAALALSVLIFRQLIELELSWLYFALAVWLEVCALLSIRWACRC